MARFKGARADGLRLLFMLPHQGEFYQDYFSFVKRTYDWLGRSCLVDLQTPSKRRLLVCGVKCGVASCFRGTYLFRIPRWEVERLAYILVATYLTPVVEGLAQMQVLPWEGPMASSFALS